MMDNAARIAEKELALQQAIKQQEFLEADIELLKAKQALQEQNVEAEV